MLAHAGVPSVAASDSLPTLPGMNEKHPQPHAAVSPKTFEWRGSRLSLDIVTHDDGTPCLQVLYRARIPLRGMTAESKSAYAKDVGNALSGGLVEMPVVDKLSVHVAPVLRDRPHPGQRAQ